MLVALLMFDGVQRAVVRRAGGLSAAGVVVVPRRSCLVAPLLGWGMRDGTATNSGTLLVTPGPGEGRLG